MEPPERDAPSQQDTFMLQLFAEKHKLEQEIEHKEAEIRELDRLYREKKAKLESDQKREQSETQFLIENLSQSQRKIHANEDALTKLRSEFEALHKTIQDKEFERDQENGLLRLRKEEFDNEVRRRDEELNQEYVRRQMNAEGVKQVRRMELEEARDKYQAEIKVIREREARQKELVAGLNRTNQSWKNLFEQKKKEQAARETELTRLLLQLKVVQEHISSLESDCKSLHIESESQSAQLQSSSESKSLLVLEVEASQDSCKTLDMKVSSLIHETEQLELKCRALFESLDRGSADITRMQGEEEAYKAAIERAASDYKQLDHTIAFVLQPEEEKLKESLKQHEIALKDLQESHRLQRDFLIRQKESLAGKVQRYQKTTLGGKETLNLDARYVDRGRDATPVAGKETGGEKSGLMKEQIETMKKNLKTLREDISSLSTRLDDRSSTHRKSQISISRKSSSPLTHSKHLSFLLGIALGAILEYWMQ